MLDFAAAGASRRIGPPLEMKIVLSIDPAQPLAAYRDALLAAGAREEEVLVVQPGDALPASFDGLLVSGGADVDPARYGEAKVNDTVTPRPERDKLDFALVERASGLGAAVFGICRGLQILNVALGGTLWQDMQSQNSGAFIQHMQRAPGNIATHYIEVEKDTRLMDILGEGLYVNSRHREGIKKLAQGLRPAARTRDGVIEAVESEEGDLIAAVQWHPENMDPETMDPLFRAFMDRVLKHMGIEE